MWVRVWLALSVSSTSLWSNAQHINAGLQQNANFGWGWQLTPGDGPSSVGQYYVKLPQSEQRVLYAADKSGYHGAVVVNTSDENHTHTSHFALGQKAIELNTQLPQVAPPQLPTIQTGSPDQNIFLLQQYPQYSTGLQQPYLLPSASTHPLPSFQNYLTPLYNFQTKHQINEASDNKARSSKPLEKDAKNEQYFATPVVQVFKDHNCFNDKDKNIASDIQESNKMFAEDSNNANDKEIKSDNSILRDIQKSKDLFDEIPSYNAHDINGHFGERETKRPLSYRGVVNFRVDDPRPNTRNDRFYYTTQVTPLATETAKYNTKDEGIRKLVESTQDLISNEDLLRINHAVERHLKEQSEDLIKSRSRFNFRGQSNNDLETLDVSPTQITVRAKFSSIVNPDNIEHLENKHNKELIFQRNSNQYTFASPIVVAETPSKKYKDQIVDNIVSTMVPYIEDGYEIVGVKKTNDESKNNNDYIDQINVTPTPLSQKYLTPITVALRLLNDNDTFNTIYDHEPSDSEIISDTVELPKKEKTYVEVQQSIPLEITHINDVEVHEYMDEGRSNKDKNLESARSIYNQYMETLRKNKLNDSINQVLSNYAKQNENSQESNKEDYNDSKDQLEPSANYHSEVQIRPDNENNQRSELAYYNNYNEYDFNEPNNNHQQIIQPIIIEKEVPITKFVDRYIEKQIPYPETVTVQVPVDRPVPVGYTVEKIDEKPFEITKYIDKPYPVHVPYPVQVKVPYAVPQKVYVDRPVHVPYPVEKVVEKQVIQHVPVPTPVAVPVEVPVEHSVYYPVAVDRPVPVPVEVDRPVETIKEVPVPYPVEKPVPYPVHYETKVPVPYAVEKRVPYPVEKIVEKPVTVTKLVDRPIHIDRPVPVPVHIHHEVPVDRIVEKKVPYPVHIEKIVEKKVPYPVEKIVEKIVEKPVVVTKYIDKPYPVEKRVPYPVEKIIQRPYAVRVPVEVKVPYPVDRIVEKKIHVPVFLRYHYTHHADESKQDLQYQLPNQKLEDQKENSPPTQIQNPNQITHSQYTQILKELMHKNAPKIQSTRWGNQYASSYQYINMPSKKPDINHHPYKFDNHVKNEPYKYESSEENSSENTRSQEYKRQNYNDHESQQNHQNNYEHPRENHIKYDFQRQHENTHNGHQNYVNQRANNVPRQQDANSQNYASESNYHRDYYGPVPMQHERDQWESAQNNVEHTRRRTDRVLKINQVNIEYGFKPPLIPSTEVDLDGMPINSSV